jgi:hypothetical protein
LNPHPNGTTFKNTTTKSSSMKPTQVPPNHTQTQKTTQKLHHKHFLAQIRCFR